ncbi:MAG: ABC transporter permease [Anaerolineales bacterium]|nr:MAG: ABC transporter permease [Anaerolineales bacterium]
MSALKELHKYPSAIAGLVIIGVFVTLSIFAVVTIPYDEAVRHWSPGSLQLREDNPRNARPVWFDWFTTDRLPRTINVNSAQGTRTAEPIGGGIERVQLTLPFSYNYDGFPRELALFVGGTYKGSPPMSVVLERPDGQTITINEGLLLRTSHRYHISQDNDLRAAIGGIPHVLLFAVDMDASDARPLHGRYTMVLEVDLPEGTRLDARTVVYGQIHGVAGTDNIRRDLNVALLWGAVVGLMFGILGAVGAQVSTFVLAGIGTWYGGKVDGIFQRITEVNLVLPMLPILIMVGYFYSRSIWLMLGLVIALNVFSGTMKTYRAMFLQAKEAPYFEAAQAYGTGNMRMVFRYLLPRLAPTLLPQFVLVVPIFVFVEASLAVLGLGDPKLPTWGKMLNDAFVGGALYRDHYYWVLQPSMLLMLIGFGFAMLGFSLDRVFNPKLRTI